MELYRRMFLEALRFSNTNLTIPLKSKNIRIQGNILHVIVLHTINHFKTFFSLAITIYLK